MEKLQELKQDVSELEKLMAQTSRPKVKDILTIECRKLVTEIVKIEEQLKSKAQETPSSTKGSTSNIASANRRYQTRLTNYAWDQTSKFIKFYVTLNNVQSLAPENVTCTFTPKTMEMNVINLDGKDYVFTINNLLNAIKPDGSNWKVKSDMVIINLAKEAADNWSHVTEVEKKTSDAKKMPQMDKGADPSDGLISIMKNMYDTGDDDMKRTIAKAWTESQQNKQGMP